MVLAIFGDIDVDATLAKLERSFGHQPRGDALPAFATPAQPKARTEQTTTAQPGTAMVMIGYPTVSALEQETRAEIAVFNSILTGGGGAGGRLFNELRGERLVYYVFGFELTGQAPGYFVFMAQTRPETLDEVVKRIQDNIAKIGAEGVPEDEFKLAKQKLIAAHSQQNVTPSSQAFQAAIDDLYGLGYDNDKQYDARIEKVTVDDVQNLVKKYFQTPIIATSSSAAAE
jgi:zinc protease